MHISYQTHRSHLTFFIKICDGQAAALDRLAWNDPRHLSPITFQAYLFSGEKRYMRAT